MPTVMLAVVWPPWRTGLVCSTTFGNKQTEKSSSIRPEDIGHCSLLKLAPCVRWDAYLDKTFVYNTCVRIFVENKYCSSVSRTRAIIFELCYTPDWRVMLCFFHTKCHVGICVLGVNSLLALSLSLVGHVFLQQTLFCPVPGMSTTHINSKKAQERTSTQVKRIHDG